jgi:hypothetical protein
VAAWTAVAWGALAGWGGYPAETATSYDYGSSVVYQDDAVYVEGEQVATAAEYSDQAAAIAEEGKKAEATKDEEWQPLGVFAMVMGEETTSNNIFQMAINKAGVIRGNYYNALTDVAEPVFGSVNTAVGSTSPEASFGSHCRFCSSVPPPRISSAAISERVPSEPTPM